MLNCRSTLRTSTATLWLAMAWVVSPPALSIEDNSGARVKQLVDRLSKADATERAILKQDLLQLGPASRTAVKEQIASCKDAGVKKILDHTATWMLAAEIAPVLQAGLDTQLTFDSQYEELKKYGDEGARTLLAIIDDSGSNVGLRIAACRAIADIGTAKLLGRLRELHGDILLLQLLREQVGILLATFGDTRAVDADLRDYTKLSRSKRREIKLDAIVQLSNLYYRIRDYKKAVEYYDEIIKMYEDILKRQRNPEFRKVLEEQLTLHYYNAACSNSLAGSFDTARKYLKRAVQGDPSHYDNMEKDGDLSRLRAQSDYPAFRRELGKLFEGEDL